MKNIFYLITIVCLFLFIQCKSNQQENYNIRNFGAIENDQKLDTESIQKAIDACSKNGGGKVIIPEGTFLSGTIQLKDNVILHIDKGGILLGSLNLNDYKNLDPFREGLGVDVGYAFIIALDAKNIGLEGNGIIDGQGSKLKAEQIKTDKRPEGQRWGRRPFLLRIVRCHGVIVKDITLKYSGAWTSHYFQSINLNIENVKIESYGVVHNDGIGIDGCQNVTIKNCDVNSGDDALVFKTTSSKMSCSNIRVSGMRLKSQQAGIKMGTESMANFENIKISDCYIYDTRNGGIKLLTVDGAHLQNIEISDITMDNVRTPMLFRLGSRLSVFRKDKDTRQETGIMKNVVIKNVKAKAAANAQLKPPSGILITGVPNHKITDLTLENIEINLEGGGTTTDARESVPEAVDAYPEVKTFGPKIPAYGIWARHVQGLKLINIKFTLNNNDLRPAFICDDGNNILLKNWQIPPTNGAEAIVRLENTENVEITDVTTTGSSAKNFVLVEGERKNITLQDNHISEVNNEIAYQK